MRGANARLLLGYFWLAESLRRLTFRLDQGRGYLFDFGAFHDGRPGMVAASSWRPLQIPLVEMLDAGRPRRRALPPPETPQPRN